MTKTKIQVEVRMAERRARFASFAFPEEDGPSEPPTPTPSTGTTTVVPSQSLLPPPPVQPPQTSPSASSSKSVNLDESLDWDPYGDVGTSAGVSRNQSTKFMSDTEANSSQGQSTLERVGRILSRPQLQTSTITPNVESRSETKSLPGPLPLSMINQLPGLGNPPKPKSEDQSVGSPDEVETIKPRDSEDSTEITTPSAYDEEEGEERSGGTRTGRMSLDEEQAHDTRSRSGGHSSQSLPGEEESEEVESHFEASDPHTRPIESHSQPTDKRPIPSTSKASKPSTHKSTHSQTTNTRNKTKKYTRQTSKDSNPEEFEQISTSQSNSSPEDSPGQQRRIAISQETEEPNSVEVGVSSESDDEIVTAARGPLSTNQSLNRVVSEASTEWEYGHSRSQSLHENEHSQSGVSVSLTDWQNSGLTRSEIEYRKKRNNSSGSYGMEVQIVAERRSVLPHPLSSTNDHRMLQRSQSEIGGNPLLLVSTGVQTSHIANRATSPSKRDRKQREVLRQKHGHPDHYKSNVLHRQPVERASMESTSFEEHMHSQNKSANTTTTNSSSSRGTSGNHLGYSFEQPSSVSSTSCCMSPTCQLISHLVQTVPKHDQEIYKAIAAHRASHLKKVRKEFHRVEELNKILRGVKHRENHHQSPESSYRPVKHKHQPKESQYRTSEIYKPQTTVAFGKSTTKSTQAPAKSKGFQEHRHSPKKVHNTNAATSTTFVPKIIPIAAPTTAFNSAANTRNQLLSALTAAVSTQIPTPVLSATAIESTSSRNVNVPHSAAVEEKLDQLLSTFNFIADVLTATQDSIIANPEELQFIPSASGFSDPNTYNVKKIKDTSQQTSKSKIKSPIKKKRKPPPCEPVKPPVSYFIPYLSTNPLSIRCRQIYCNANGFDNASREASDSSSGSDRSNKENRHQTLHRDKESRIRECLEKMSLEDICKQNNPHFIQRVQQREGIIAQIKAEREIRAKIKRDWVLRQGTTRMSSLERALPPKGQRLMSEREIKEITKKKYKQLPEVQQKKLERKAEEEKRTNRLIANVFARKLRQNVLKGNTNIGLSKSIIRK